MPLMLLLYYAEINFFYFFIFYFLKLVYFQSANIKFNLM